MKRKCPSAKDAESSSDGVLFLDGKLRPSYGQLRYIQQTYGTEQMPEVVIKGDAAAWIKSGTEYVWNSTHVVDGYHASQYLRKIAGRVQVRPCMRH